MSKWTDTEEGYLACRVANLRSAITLAIRDLTEQITHEPSPGDQAVMLKVVNDLVKACEHPAPQGPQPIGRAKQSLCVHCDRRTGSRTARLCKSCRGAMKESA